MKAEKVNIKENGTCELCTEPILKGSVSYVYYLHGINHARAHMCQECGEMAIKTGAKNPEKALEVMDQELKDYGVDTNLLSVKDVVKKFNTMRYIKETRQPDAKDRDYRKREEDEMKG